MKLSHVPCTPTIPSHQDDVSKFTEGSSESVFAETYASNLEYSLKWSEELGVKLDQTTVNTTFNTDSEFGGGKLARQLNQVAKLIKLDVNTLKTERAAYLTSLGGWDGRYFVPINVGAMRITNTISLNIAHSPPPNRTISFNIAHSPPPKR